MTGPTLREMMGGNDEKAWAVLRMYDTEPCACKGRMFKALIAYYVH